MKIVEWSSYFQTKMWSASAQVRGGRLAKHGSGMGFGGQLCRRPGKTKSSNNRHLPCSTNNAHGSGWEWLGGSFSIVFIVDLINRPPHLLSCFVCRMSFHFLSRACKASFARHLPLVAGYTTHPFAQMMVQPLANLGSTGSRTPTENIK